jgi:hypothetical protein
MDTPPCDRNINAKPITASAPPSPKRSIQEPRPQFIVRDNASAFAAIWDGAETGVNTWSGLASSALSGIVSCSCTCGVMVDNLKSGPGAIREDLEFF